MAQNVAWSRILAEGSAIVVSILLAFSIQAWWERSQEREAELASLALIDRDLTDAIQQLEEFETLMDGSLQAAVSAYRAMSGPAGAIDQPAVSADIVRTSLRRTVSLPTAAYTDLVSTGNLRVISDQRLRDEILRFYASAERAQAIIERNNTVLIDGLIWTGLFGEGLVLPLPGAPAGVGLPDLIADSLRAALGDPAVHDSDPLWSLPPDSPEWNETRGTLLIFSRSAIASTAVAGQTREAAVALRSRVRELLPYQPN